jgi:hypothetical protein
MTSPLTHTAATAPMIAPSDEAAQGPQVMANQIAGAAVFSVAISALTIITQVEVATAMCIADWPMDRRRRDWP